jgi:transposase
MWDIVKPLLPVPDLGKGGGRRRYGNRLVLDSIFYVLRSGCQWRMLPHDLMPWDAAHRWFTKWPKDGTWTASTKNSADKYVSRRDAIPSRRPPVIGAQSIKSREGGEARGFDAGKRTTGRYLEPAHACPSCG